LEFTREAFRHLDNATKELTEEQLDWKSCPEANTIRNILDHLFVEWYGSLPKITSGNTVLPDEDISVIKQRILARGYTGVKGKSIEQIKINLTEGKKYVYSELGKLNDEDLAKEITWFRGKQPLSNYLMIFPAEILHHEGQIAAILGVKKRIKGL